MTNDELRPREFALLLLAADGAPPRQRARDQQADRTGLELRRRVLDHLVIIDPSASELDAVLLQIVELVGSPTGPTRAIAAGVRDDWMAARADPKYVEHLIGQAVIGGEDQHKGKRRDAKVSA